MDHPYSFWADLLSKFQGATPWIQALWLVLVAAVAMGVVWCVADVVKAVVRRRGKAPARPVYGLVRDEEGRWLVCIDGEPRPVEGTGAGFEGSAVGVRSADRFNPAILPPGM